MTAQTGMVPHIAEASGGEADDDLVLVLPRSTAVDDDRNWALDEDVKRYVLEEIYNVLGQVRQEMVPIHEEWKAVRRMGTLTHDEGQRYKGRSNAYLPLWARAKKTLVSTLSQSLFPSDEFLDVTDKERPQDAGSDRAKAVKTYIQWEFEKNAKLRSNIKPFLGTLVDCGTSVAKYWYEKESKGKKQGRVKKGGLPKAGTDSYSAIPSREGLRFSTRSLFDWYVFPLNIDSLDQATLVFEDIDIPRQYIRERERKGEWVNIQEALDAPEIPEHTDNQQELNQEMLQSPGFNARNLISELSDMRTVTEIWCEMPMPAAAYMEDEDQDCPIPVKIVMAGDVIFQVVRNPFWHQSFPYLVARDSPEAGCFYPKGTGHLARALQYLVNDFTNQLNDNGTYALNPIVIYNPSTLAGPLPPLKPGVTWPTTDVAGGIKFDRPPIEQIQYGMSLVSNYSGQLADLTGATPALQGAAGGKNSKTATGMQILQKNASTPLKDLVEDIENDVLTPLICGTWVLGQQYREQEFIAEVMGLGPDQNPSFVKMTREELAGDYLFRWLASSQAANQAQRAQQGMSLLQILPPLMPLLQAAGHQVDPLPLIKRIYADGFGFRGFDQFIKAGAAPPPVAPPGMPGAPGAGGPGAPPDAGLEQVRSAVMQDENAGAEQETMAGGEGDELTALRAQIEAQNAEDGKQNF